MVPDRKPRGYWGVFFAVGLALLAGSTNAQDPHGVPPERVTPESPAVQEQPDGRTDSGQGQTTRQPFPVTIVESPEDAEARRNSERKAEQHEADDLAAQRKAADAAEAGAAAAERQIVPTWIQTGIAVIGTLALLYTLWLTREANRISREIGQAQVRAYLGIQGGDILSPATKGEDFEVEDDGCIALKAKFSVKNFGQSPAAHIFLQHKEKTVGAAILDSFDTSLDEVDTGNAFLGPGDGILFEINNVLNTYEHIAMLKKDVYTMIFGRIDYTDVFDQKWTHEFC